MLGVDEPARLGARPRVRCVAGRPRSPLPGSSSLGRPPSATTRRPRSCRLPFVVVPHDGVQVVTAVRADRDRRRPSRPWSLLRRGGQRRRPRIPERHARPAAGLEQLTHAGRRARRHAGPSGEHRSGARRGLRRLPSLPSCPHWAISLGPSDAHRGRRSGRGSCTRPSGAAHPGAERVRQLRGRVASRQPTGRRSLSAAAERCPQNDRRPAFWRTASGRRTKVGLHLGPTGSDG